MLENLSRYPPGQTAPATDSKFISDPWEEPSPVVESYSIPDSWKLPTEAHPLLSPAGKPGALQLKAPPELSSTEVLLQDELKLRDSKDEQLKIQMRKALALLCWLEMGCGESAA